jgi:magnesium-transporting ATPase (P-type)
MKIHQLSAEAAPAGLHSRPEGLSADEDRRRLQEFGPNRIERPTDTPLALRFARGFVHFFALILWCAAALAFVAERHDPGSGMVPPGSEDKIMHAAFRVGGTTLLGAAGLVAVRRLRRRVV